jgi:eukaryotic-like serine/threonine-protein kinase
MIAPGTRLGPYVIAAPIGAGGMGEVYKATDTRLDRTVAIKVLPEHVASDPELKQRFEREAKTLAALSHPHICPVFDVGSQDGIDFLVMEFLEGETLEQRLKKGALPLDGALQIGIQIADALAAAHRAGIIHRDLKPGNIILTKSGAKLLDFGLAKTGSPAVAGSLSMLPTTPPNLTAQGAILGTFQYMAPEQLEGQEADARTDVFAFGAVLYEMVTGKKAFEGKSQASLIAAILTQYPPAVSGGVPLAPPALDRVVHKCLDKNPERRWQSAQDLRDELEWTASGPAAAHADSIVHVPSKRRRFTQWVTAMTALAAAAAMAIAVVRSRPTGNVTTPELRLELNTPATTDSISLALSPDGSRIVFVGIAAGRSQLWLRRLDTSMAAPLERTDGASNPFWSPDSGSVGFFAEGKLKRIDLASGSVQTLGDANASTGGAWGPDGTILFALGPASGIAKIRGAGGQVSPVTDVRSQEQGHRFPQFLPDGRHFLFFVRGADDVRGVYIGSLDGEAPRRLFGGDTAAPVYPLGEALVFVRQGALYSQRFDQARRTLTGDAVPIANQVAVDAVNHAAFSVAANGTIAYRSAAGTQRRQFVWFDRSGRELARVGEPDDARAFSPVLGPDGRRVAMHRTIAGNVDIWVLDTARGVLTRVTTDPTSDISPIWSPDGTRLVFTRFRMGMFELFIKTLAGGAEEPLHVMGGFPADWSPDGSVILYEGTLDSRLQGVWALPLNTRKPYQLLRAPAEHPQFSPDGRWITFVSEESGQSEVYVAPFPMSGETIRVSAAGGAQPRWSSDGRELFYIALDDRLMAVRTNRRSSGEGVELELGPPVALFATRVGGALQELTSARYMPARDGRFLMSILLEDVSAPPITVILNLRSRLSE